MKHIILLSLIFILVGCGGGDSGGESPDANNSSSSASDVNDSSDSGSSASDSAAPLLESITADPVGDKITFRFNESIVISGETTTDFQITQDGDSVAISNITVDGGSVILTVSDLSNSALQVSYSPSANPIQDLAGNSTASFTQLVVSDGYIRGAKVYADTNGNGIPEESELIQGLTSDALGQLVINGLYGNAEIIIKGGVNVDTGAINQLKLTAPVGYSVINPLSTLVQKIFASDDNQTIEQAEISLQEALGITLAQGKSLSSYDPISDVTENAIANRVATLQIATVLAIAAAADVSNQSNIEAEALDNMVTIVKATDGKITLNNEIVRQILSDDSDTILVSVEDLSDVTSAVVAMETIKQNPDFGDGQIDLAAEIAKIIQVQSDAIDKVKPARPTLTIDANQLKISFDSTLTDGTAAVAGDTIQVLDGNEEVLRYVLTDADISEGYYSVYLSKLGELDTQLAAKIIDIAGNESDLSSATGIDTVPPSLTSATTANFSGLGVVYRAAIDDSTDTVDEITYSISDTTDYSPEQKGLAQSTVTIPELAENTQHVYVSSSTKSEDGTKETVVISYNAEDTTTTGLGIRVHFDSSAINVHGVSDLFGQGLLSPSSDPVADANNHDGDTNTDQHITLAWASISASNWPGLDGPVDLATITFDIDQNATGSSAINFTASSNAVGFDFDGQTHNLALKTIKLSFDSASGALTLTSDLDLALLPPFSFILTASDLAGNKSEQTVSLSFKYADKASIIRIFDKGQVGPEWDTGIQGYDEGNLNWGSCSNPSGCPNIDWTVVADDERGNVLEITHAGTDNTAGLIIMSSNPVDLRNAEIDGVLKLDIKVVSGDRNISFRPDCIYPCAGAFYSKSIDEYNQWQTVSVAVEDLIPNGPDGNVLDLEIVRSALVMEADSATKFRIDNAYFDCGEVITCAGVSDLFVPVDWAATHEDPNLGYGNDAIPREYPGYTMVWSDNFDGDVVDGDNWDFDLGNGMNGWGNGERQYYRQQNATVDDGLLIIEAKKHVPYINIGSITGIHYTSARLVTRGKMEFKYGRVDIRAVVAQGQGMWSAGWMLGANHSLVGWPQSGEIDIFETIGGQNRESKMINNMFWDPDGSFTQADIVSRGLAEEFYIESSNSNETFANQFHVFSLIWDEDTIQFEVDGVNTGNDINLVGDLADTFRNPFYLLLNVAVGGAYPGYPDETTLFPDGMLVDYVRVYQRDSDGDGIADYALDGETTLDESLNDPSNP